MQFYDSQQKSSLKYYSCSTVLVEKIHFRNNTEEKHLRLVNRPVVEDRRALSENTANATLIDVSDKY